MSSKLIQPLSGDHPIIPKSQPERLGHHPSLVLMWPSCFWRITRASENVPADRASLHLSTVADDLAGTSQALPQIVRFPSN
jgi:hypothetical protein